MAARGRLAAGAHEVQVDGNIAQGPQPVTAIVMGDSKVRASALPRSSQGGAGSAMRRLHGSTLYMVSTCTRVIHAQHLDALERHGACAVHRRSFAPVRRRLERA